MKLSAKKYLLTILGTYPAGRLCPVRNDDTFIVSYPKSGNTWMRFLIANLLYPDNVSFSNIEDLIPDIYQHSLYFLTFKKSPRILKSHEMCDVRYKKVIYIVRDPRDVAVSYWHHKVKFHAFDEDYPMSDFVDDFLTGKDIPFGSWAENVNGWLATNKNNHDFLFLRYEDLIAFPEQEMHKVVAHLGLSSLTGQNIKNAIENASFEKLRKLEQEQKNLWSAVKSTRQDKPFVRKGQAGNWKNELPADAVQRIEFAWGPLMHQLGYF